MRKVLNIDKKKLENVFFGHRAPMNRGLRQILGHTLFIQKCQNMKICRLKYKRKELFVNAENSILP